MRDFLKRCFLPLLSLLPLCATAQAPFGYLSFSEVVRALPEYSAAQDDLRILQGQYDEEIERSETDLTKKYVDFLEDQNKLPENIRQKRQKELQELMERNIAFKEEVRRTLNEARDSLFYPMQEKVKEAVKALCVDRMYAYAIDIDKESFLFINEAAGAVNITIPVKILLGIKVPVEPIVPVIGVKEERADSIVKATLTDTIPAPVNDQVQEQDSITVLSPEEEEM